MNQVNHFFEISLLHHPCDMIPQSEQADRCSLIMEIGSCLSPLSMFLPSTSVQEQRIKSACHIASFRVADEIAISSSGRVRCLTRKVLIRGVHTIFQVTDRC
jgi:hypothetical protein